PARGVIIPFPVEAIRRPPAPAFVTRPLSLEPDLERRRAIRTWVSIGVLLVALVAGVVVLCNAWTGTRTGSGPGATVVRTSAPAAPAEAPAVARGMNLLVAGLAGDGQTGLENGPRSDALMLFHVDADRQRAYLVTLPRDAWVS